MHCTSDVKRTARTTTALVPERLRHEKEAFSPASAADTLAAAHAIDPHTPWSTRRIRFIWLRARPLLGSVALSHCFSDRTLSARRYPMDPAPSGRL